MKFAFFAGCKIPYYLKHYESASRAVLKALDIELVDIEFTCCGYPIRSYDFFSFILSAARNFAIAEKHDLNILTPCKCCFGSLKHADHFLRTNDKLKKNIQLFLQEEDLIWEGRSEVKHLLTVLSDDVGIDKIRTRIKHPVKGLKIAASYGCHALRPDNIVNFDNPLAPTIFENLVGATGAESVDWSKRLDCCGNPLWGKNSPLSLDLMQKKLVSARQAGADLLCSSCTYCQIQFDSVQNSELSQIKKNDPGPLPSVLYPQLLGFSMGLGEKQLGLDANEIEISALLKA